MSGSGFELFVEGLPTVLDDYQYLVAVDWETQRAKKINFKKQRNLLQKGDLQNGEWIVEPMQMQPAMEPNGDTIKNTKDGAQRVQLECLFLRCKQRHGSVTIMLSERPLSRPALFHLFSAFPTYEVKPLLPPQNTGANVRTEPAAVPIVYDGVRYARVGTNRYHGPLCAGAGYIAATQDPTTGRVTRTPHCSTISLVGWHSPDLPGNRPDFAPFDSMGIGLTLARFFQRLDIDHPTVTALDLSGISVFHRWLFNGGDASLSIEETSRLRMFQHGARMQARDQAAAAVDTVCWALEQGYCRNLHTLILSPYPADTTSYYHITFVIRKSSWLNLFHALVHDDCCIHTLSLSGCEVKQNYMADALMRNRSLRHLSLSNCRLRDKHIVRLAKALKLNRTLLSLDLSHNAAARYTNSPSITHTGFKALAAALESNESLQSLDLDGVQMDNYLAESLVAALQHNTTVLQVTLALTMTPTPILTLTLTLL